MTKALLALEDGRTFTARAFAGSGDTTGELVFNTSMTGYQEILTDPSYHGQIVTLTYPLIGNYGINAADAESSRICAAALVVGECSGVASNWRSERSLADYLESAGLIGIDQLDTRAVTLHIRNRGAMKCAISTTELDPERLVARACAARDMVGADLASEVTTPAVYKWNPDDDGRFSVAVIDSGVKYNILRELAKRGCAVTVYPLHTPAAEILASRPDGVMLANGPGDPSALTTVVDTIREIVASDTPIMGICLGHQMLCLALGGRTYKLKFGHRGANHPVLNVATGRVEITTQNHGFCVDADSLDSDIVEITHVNLNDQTVEGIRHRHKPVFSVQHHPEAAAGPHDSAYLFDDFVATLATRSSQPPCPTTSG